MSCANCDLLTKKALARQSDYEFELKKIEEDAAEKKIVYELASQREIAKLKETLKIEREHHQEESKRWLKNHDELVRQNQIALDLLKSKLATQYELSLENQKNLWLEKAAQEQEKADQANLQLKMQAAQTETHLRQSHEQQISELRNHFLLRLQQEAAAANCLLESTSKELQSKILALKSQLNTEEQLHLKSKAYFDATVETLQNELHTERKNSFGLSQRINMLGQELSQSQSEKESLVEKLEKMKEQHRIEVESLQEQHKQKVLEDEEKYQEKLKEYYEESLYECRKFEQILSDIEAQREKEQTLHNQTVKIMESCLEERPSRSEDVEQILKLKNILASKEKELRNLAHELKLYRLELNNKEETYNRIFMTVNHIPLENTVGRKKEPRRKPGRSLVPIKDTLLLDPLNNGEIRQSAKLKGSKVL